MMLESEPAHIEHINQIIYNTRGYDEWYCFDSADLLEQHKEFGTYDKTNPANSKITKELVDIRYDFLIVNLAMENGAYVYTFEVRNTLWDGKYRISRSKRADVFHKIVVVTTDDEDHNLLRVTLNNPDDMKDIRVCFHLSQIGVGRDIDTNCIILKNDSYYEDVYDQSIFHKGQVFLAQNTTNQGAVVPLQKATVTLTPCDSLGQVLDSGLPKYTAITDSKGYFNMCYGKVKRPATYYALLTASFVAYSKGKTLTATSIVKIDKYQDKDRIIDVPASLNAYKGSIQEFTIRCGLVNRYGVHDKTKDTYLEGTLAQVTAVLKNGKEVSQTCKADKNGDIHPLVSYRGFYNDVSTLKITLPKTEEFGTKSKAVKVYMKWFVANSYENIRAECARDYGADFIMVPETTFKRSGQVIKILRDQTLCSYGGANPTTDKTVGSYTFNKSWPTLDGNNQRIIEIAKGNGADAHTKLYIGGIKLKNGNNAIYMNEYTALTVNGCYFNNNTYPYTHYKGSCIYNKQTATTLKYTGYFTTKVYNSYFLNNYGADIHSLGTTIIDKNLFECVRSECLQQPEPKVINVYNGAVTYKNNKSYVSTKGQGVRPMNSSYAKALTYIDQRGTFNGKGQRQLKAYNSLPLYSKPWNNQAYTYCIYYYPYKPVCHNISCSPKKGRERSATGHASYVKRWEDSWVYYDGYWFDRYYSSTRGQGNTHDPWTKTELAVPLANTFYNTKKGFTKQLPWNTAFRNW